MTATDRLVPFTAILLSVADCAQHQSKGPFFSLVSGLQEALDGCPAMPGATLEASIEDCLRRPLPGATWSLRTIPMFVHGVLSLVTQSPRSLCQTVVPLLVRFVAETECQVDGEFEIPGSAFRHM